MKVSLTVKDLQKKAGDASSPFVCKVELERDFRLKTLKAMLGPFTVTLEGDLLVVRWKTVGSAPVLVEDEANIAQRGKSTYTNSEHSLEIVIAY